jgi:hypothetical protein
MNPRSQCSGGSRPYIHASSGIRTHDPSAQVDQDHTFMRRAGYESTIPVLRRIKTIHLWVQRDPNPRSQCSRGPSIRALARTATGTVVTFLLFWVYVLSSWRFSFRIELLSSSGTESDAACNELWQHATKIYKTTKLSRRTELEGMRNALNQIYRSVRTVQNQTVLTPCIQPVSKGYGCLPRLVLNMTCHWVTRINAGTFLQHSGRGLRIFLFTTASRTALEPTQSPIQWVPEAFSLGVKRPGREADHSPPSSAEVKNVWGYTSTLPIHLNGVVLS